MEPQVVPSLSRKRRKGALAQRCPLCERLKTNIFLREPGRAYYRCPDCRLIFADPAALPSPEEEKQRYLLHRNSPDDQNYREFLSRLAGPLAQHLGNKPLAGLDFGCGPGPALSVILEEMGYLMETYDPFFADNPSALSKQYDFVTCTETIEHFHFPGKEWSLLLSIIKPGGWLGIMTKMVADPDNENAFAGWHYRTDFTHVSFFSKETFRYLSKRDGLTVQFIDSDVILLKKHR